MCGVLSDSNQLPDYQVTLPGVPWLTFLTLHVHGPRKGALQERPPCGVHSCSSTGCVDLWPTGCVQNQSTLPPCLGCNTAVFWGLILVIICGPKWVSWSQLVSWHAG
jgi:hypothetical protein